MKLLIRFLIACVVCGLGWLPGFAEESAEWNQWRGPRRDGTVPQSSLPDTLEASMKLRWEKPLGPSYSGPIVCGDLVFTTETINKESERVTAFSLKSGELVWKVEWPGAMAVPFFAAANGDWIRSTPVCDGKHLVVLGMRDVLVCLEPTTGNELWRVDFPTDLKKPMQPFGAVCSPLIEDGAVYVQAGAALTKLSLADGSVVWQALKGSGDMMTGGAFSSPVVATLAGKRQIVVQTREELCGVDPASGDVLWRETIEAFRGMNILTPLVIGDNVFTAAHSGKSQLFTVSQSDAGEWSVSEVWNQKSQGYMSSPIQIGDSIYLHQKSQRLTCLAVADGSMKWTSEPFGKYWSMLHNGDKILALDETGELFLIRPNTEKLEIIDRHSVASDSWAHVALQDGTLIVRDLEALKVFDWK